MRFLIHQQGPFESLGFQGEVARISHMGSMEIYAADALRGKRYLVTGGGSGIGQALTLRLIDLGAKVFILGREEKKLQNTVKLLQKRRSDLEPALSYFAADLRDPESVRVAVSKSIKFLKGIDGLVNNAGGQFPARLEKLSPNGWNSVINNNLNSTFYVSREVLLQSMKEKGGVIVNMVAECRNGMTHMGHSGAARAGIINFTYTAAQEWAAYGIRVNAIAPGIIESSGLDQYPEDFKKVLKSLKSKIPLRRFGSLDEVVDPIVFLLSPAANFLTGIVLPVDGGQRLSGSM